MLALRASIARFILFSVATFAGAYRNYTIKKARLAMMRALIRQALKRMF